MFLSLQIKKPDGRYNEIGIIKCRYAYGFIDSPSSNPDIGPDALKHIDFCFEDYLPLSSIPYYQYVEEGDIINIRTMINLDFPPFPEYGDHIFADHILDSEEA